MRHRNAGGGRPVSPDARFYAICFSMNPSLILLSLAALHSDASLVVDTSTARRAVTAAPAAASAQQMQRQATDGAADALVVSIRTVLADPAFDLIAREWLLEQGLAALRSLPATPAGRALALELSARAPRIYARVEPEHGGQAVPLYDPGAAARFALHEWARMDARTTAAQSLRLGTTTALQSLMTDAAGRTPAAVRDGTADAFAAADTAALLRQRPAIIAAIREGRDVDRVALATARRLRDAELYSLVVVYAEPAVALAAVRSVSQDLDAGTALAVLEKAADREPVGSAALLAIGRLADTAPGAQGALLARIADPVSGGSAAAALAGIEDPVLAMQLGARLQDTSDETTRRRIALALKLNGGSAARQALARFVDGKQGSTEFGKEVAAWLAATR